MSPPSHCPGCDAPIAPYDNIPVVSWLVLRGRCRRCGEHISARYPLVELLGGRPTPGIGFALGLDRVLLALEEVGASPVAEPAPLAVVCGVDPEAGAERFRIATMLRAEGLAVRAELGARKLGRQLEAAVKEGARYAVILGDELAEGEVTLRDLGAASQKAIPLADLVATLRRKAATAG